MSSNGMTQAVQPYYSRCSAAPASPIGILRGRPVTREVLKTLPTSDVVDLLDHRIQELEGQILIAQTRYAEAMGAKDRSGLETYQQKQRVRTLEELLSASEARNTDLKDQLSVEVTHRKNLERQIAAIKRQSEALKKSGTGKEQQIDAQLQQLAEAKARSELLATQKKEQAALASTQREEIVRKVAEADGRAHLERSQTLAYQQKAEARSARLERMVKELEEEGTVLGFWAGHVLKIFS